jgi:glycosidase
MSKILTSISLIFLFTFFGCKNNQNQSELNKDTLISHVPQWSRQAIWYQIFPERFRNGDTKNDPKKEDIVGTYPDQIPDNWKTTPWEQDWYKKDDWFKNSNLTNEWDKLQLRRFGGDIQGIIDELDYLKDLGINAIYLNPINDSPSLHKYDPRTWHHVDVNFGPNPKADKKIIASENPADTSTWKWTNADKLFLKLINECHRKNIKIILDYSWNHTGSEFWAFKDVKEKGLKSDFADWYEIEKFDNTETPENEFKYNGWAGVKYMPEIKKDLKGNPEDLPRHGNIHSQSVKQHIFSVAARWLDPNKDGNPSDGIDGYRLDVAEKLPIEFWKEFRIEVRKINPEAILVGEIWWKKWPEELLGPNDYLQGDVFDAIMNYRWYQPARHFFAAAPDKLYATKFEDLLKEKREGISKERQQAMMNLISSHDAPRVSTSIYNGGKYKFQEKPYDNPNYKIDKPGKETRETLKMLLIHQFTYIGSPHIWYGDEVGMWGADDPDCRKPMIWSDLKYEDETNHPYYTKRKTDKVEQDLELLDFYKKIIKIRKENIALSLGNVKFIDVDNAENTFGYERNYEDNQVIVVFNNDDKGKVLEINTSGKEYKNALKPELIFEPENNKLVIPINKKSALILIKMN